MPWQEINSLAKIQEAISTSDSLLIYFSSPSCSVCKVLRPKISELMGDKFPRTGLFYVNIEESPVISGQFRIFSLPTILVFFAGKETMRKSRNLSLNELYEAIERPYNLLFK